jgi:Tol biopolymer transport system component
MDEQRLERALREGPRFRTQYAAGPLALDRPLARPAPHIGRMVLVLAVTGIMLALTFGALAAAGFFDDEPSSYAIVVEQMLLPPDEGFAIRHLVFEPDASSPEILEGFPSNATQLSWSPNARRVAYFTLDQDVPDGEQPFSRDGLFIADADGQDPIPVATPRPADRYVADAWWSGPAWSPASDRVALTGFLDTCDDDAACWFIDVFDTDGRLVVSIPVDGDPGLIQAAQWSPDSRWVGWMTHICAQGPCNETIFHARSIDDPGQEVSLSIGAPGDVRWSSDGRLLVVVTDQYGETERVYSVATDGSGEQDVDWNEDHDQGSAWVRWSDDGQHLLMGPRFEHPWFVRNLESGVDTLLAYPGPFGLSVWSPDATWLVVANGAPFPVDDAYAGSNRLFALNADGSGQPAFLGTGMDVTWLPLE